MLYMFGVLLVVCFGFFCSFVFEKFVCHVLFGVLCVCLVGSGVFFVFFCKPFKLNLLNFPLQN